MLVLILIFSSRVHPLLLSIFASLTNAQVAFLSSDLYYGTTSTSLQAVSLFLILFALTDFVFPDLLIFLSCVPLDCVEFCVTQHGVSFSSVCCTPLC
jgi:hypothetical protein